jgi:(2Fe-2S) ferredoxin
MTEDEGFFGDSVQAYAGPVGDRDADGTNYRKHILVCTNRGEDGCASKGGFEVKKRFFNEIKRSDFDRIKVSSVGTMGFCDQGPIAVVYPDGIWYKDLSVNDVEKILESHIRNDQPVDELTFDPSFPDDFTHFIVCTFFANCAQEGGGKVYQYLSEQAADIDEVMVTNSNGCLKDCTMGPVACAYPDGDWYAGMTTEARYQEVWADQTENAKARMRAGKTEE